MMVQIYKYVFLNRIEPVEVAPLALFQILSDFHLKVRHARPYRDDAKDREDDGDAEKDEGGPEVGVPLIPPRPPPSNEDRDEEEGLEDDQRRFCWA